MSADSHWDIQTGIFSRLTGNAELTALLPSGADSIFDHVPAGTAFPYVVIGETRSRPMDTQTTSGLEAVISIQIYSQAAGMKETKNIMSRIYDALHNASFSIPNQVLVMCRLADTDTALEADGVTRHGVQRFQIITEPV